MTPKQNTAFRRGLREAFGMPALVLSSSMIGFGSLARESGMDLIMTVLTTIGIYGLPGQIVMVEMVAAGAPVFAIAIGVGVANARFLPMTLALSPYINQWPASIWRKLAFSHLVTLTPWAAALRYFPEMENEERIPYYMGYSLLCILGATAGTAIGHFLAAELPGPIAISLVFLSPAFFSMVFADVRHRLGMIAVTLGAGVGPVLHDLTPDWGLPATGLIAGTAAFLIDRLLKKREQSGGAA
ncbi:MAG: AzlC family ABC transporter permease [Rhodospirillales bacterium]